MTANALLLRASSYLGVSRLSGKNIKSKLASIVDAQLIEPFQMQQGGRIYYRALESDSPMSLAV
jgi:hypothetical protein